MMAVTDTFSGDSSRGCVLGDRPPTRRCTRGTVLAAYYRDFDQESLAVPHPHRCPWRALNFDDQIPRLPQRPDQLGTLFLEHLAGQPLQNPASSGQQHRDATIGAGYIGSPGDTDAARQIFGMIPAIRPGQSTRRAAVATIRAGSRAVASASADR
jgi:hypothetical protein